MPNVVPIIDTGETTDEWVIAMPRAERSLRAELASGRMTPEQAARYARAGDVHIAYQVLGEGQVDVWVTAPGDPD